MFIHYAYRSVTIQQQAQWFYMSHSIRMIKLKL